jgi:hypothetical protein
LKLHDGRLVKKIIGKLKLVFPSPEGEGAHRADEVERG